MKAYLTDGRDLFLDEKDEEGMDVEDQDIQTDLNEEEVGNRNRTMWKKIGWAVATNVSFLSGSRTETRSLMVLFLTTEQTACL